MLCGHSCAGMDFVNNVRLFLAWKYVQFSVLDIRMWAFLLDMYMLTLACVSHIDIEVMIGC